MSPKGGLPGDLAMTRNAESTSAGSLPSPTPLTLSTEFRVSRLLLYLEQGEIGSVETWSRIKRIFGGEFIGFAIWFH